MSFTLAHLSDLHLSTPSLTPWRFLCNKRLLGYLSWYGQRRHEYRQEVLTALVDDWRTHAVDHTVITGDLTQLGLPDEYRQVREWLAALDTPERVTVIAGNHDAYAACAWKDTIAHWWPYMRSDTDGAAVEEGSFPTVRHRAGIHLIGVSTAVPSPPLMATGRVGTGQAQRLATVLAQSVGCFRVVLMHHPPVAGRWHKRLVDQPMLRNVLQTQGAELVLHGHWHRSAFHPLTSSHGVIPIIGVPAASARGYRVAPAAYHLYRIDRTATGWSLRIMPRGYSTTLQQFIPLKEWTFDRTVC